MAVHRLLDVGLGRACRQIQLRVEREQVEQIMQPADSCRRARRTVALDVERRAREWSTQLSRRGRKNPHELLDVIASALRQADTYDRELFQQMGVKTIWLNDFNDIPRVLEKISQR